ncbi:MAG: DegV family protein, partial [Tepidiformaceae bacterium]
YLEEHAVPDARLRIGISNGAADDLANELEARVRASRVGNRIEDLVQYEVGPAVGAHTGPGCTGIVFQSLAE